MIAERITVTHIRPPVSSRAFDYCAIFDSYDGADDAPEAANPVGRGPSRYDAIIDLLFQVDG